MIPAHKFLLAIGSPVFEAMFYGELLESRDTIELPDCDYESLLELFRYMYSDEVNLSGSNVSVKSKLQHPPSPWAYPGHLTTLQSREGGNLIIRVFQGVGNLIPMLKGRGI